ncbi:MAG TPA: NAD(P)H-dependent oxidoreductase [Pseudomonadales bacterium]
MSSLLLIKTSLFPDGASTQLAELFARRWRAAHPDGRVIERDLAADPVPHLDAERFAGFTTPADERTPEQQQAVAYSDALIDELREADVLALGLPMYNFGLPSTLKAYFDHIARAGVTFRYTEAGSQGLLGGRKVYVFAARGGLYQANGSDTQTRYLQDFLGFLGLDDVTFVYAEGLKMGPDHRERALVAAREAIGALPV